MLLRKKESSMTKWDIKVGLGFGLGLVLMSIITLVNAAMVGVAASRPISFGTFIVGLSVFLGFLLVALIAYWVYGLASASYLLDRNALIINWGTSKQVIPTDAIEQVFTGDEIAGDIRFYGGRWPGHWVGYGELPDAGATLFYATRPLAEQIFVVTPGLVYAISPANREDFLESFQKRLQMGPTQAMEQSSKRPSVLDWAIWQDPLGLALLGVGILGLVALVGLLTFRFPNLPMLMPLHFAASGSPDRLGPRIEVFLLPLIGLLSLLVNGVLGGISYRHHRVASYMLWSSSILIQLLVWAATFGILSRV
jgi:hypothetical protein